MINKILFLVVTISVGLLLIPIVNNLIENAQMYEEIEVIDELELDLYGDWPDEIYIMYSPEEFDLILNDGSNVLYGGYKNQMTNTISYTFPITIDKYNTTTSDPILRIEFDLDGDGYESEISKDGIIEHLYTDFSGGISSFFVVIETKTTELQLINNPYSTILPIISIIFMLVLVGSTILVIKYK